MRPDSIRKFEMLWFTAIVLGLINFVLGFATLKAQAEAELAGTALTFSPSILIAGIAVGTAINVALWFLVAHKAIGIVKWVILILFVWGLISAPAMFVDGLQTIDVIAIVAMLLQAAAIFFLFRPDATAWFASKGGRANP